jgi:bidirectional [NiFe] hydrogenase diaphorase subunit
MQATASVVPPTADDARWRTLQETMRRHGFAPDALIETLHSAQQAFGYLNEPALRFVARGLNVPLSRVYGVATFYHLFSLEPPAEHTCVVCAGTACYIKGSGPILAAAKQENTTDGRVAIHIARCFGPCGLAPLVEFDGEAAGKTTPSEVAERIRRWLHDAS